MKPAYANKAIEQTEFDFRMQEINLFDIFSMGVDYGLLLAEQERMSEEWADAFCGHLVSQKYSMPSVPIERRQIHSDEWFKEKQKSYKTFLSIWNETKGIIKIIDDVEK